MMEERDIISELDAVRWGGDSNLIELQIVDDVIVGSVPIDRLALTSPFSQSPWFDGPGVSRAGVQAAIDSGDFETSPYPGFSYSGKSAWDTARHERRIAYLTVFKDQHPIEIEFVDAYHDSLEVQDGWHRLAAAIMRGERDIFIAVGGFFRFSVSRLGAICRGYCVLGSQHDADAYWQGAPPEDIADIRVHR